MVRSIDNLMKRVRKEVKETNKKSEDMRLEKLKEQREKYKTLIYNINLEIDEIMDKKKGV